MKAEITKAAEVVRNGGIILYPTDTIWGIGCDPSNEEAVKKIFQLKQREDAKSVLILVSTEVLLSRYAKEIPEVCYDLIDYADKPLTIIYPQGQYVAKQVLAEDGSLGIRMTKNKFCSELMRQTRCGLVSTSANIAGQPSPTSFSEISKEIIEGVDYVVNLKDEEIQGTASPSQIIKIEADGTFKLIRK